MSVFVDNMRARYGRLIMCHMIADTDAELHAMADRIGVARKWHQAPPEHDSHYDIALSKRALAVAAGAVEITLRECAVMSGHRRRTGRLPSREEVPALMRMAADRIRQTVSGKALVAVIERDVP